MQIPQELLSLYNTPEYDGSGTTELQNLEFFENELILHVSSYSYEDIVSSPLKLSIAFENVVDFLITEQSWDYFEELVEHSSLLPYLQPRCELYIKNAPENLEVAFVTCLRSLDRLMPEQQNGLAVLGLSASSFLSILTRGFGRVANGPKLFIDKLVDILKAHGAHPTVLPSYPLSKSWIIEDTHGNTPYVKEEMRVMQFGQNWVLYEKNR